MSAKHVMSPKNGVGLLVPNRAMHGTQPMTLSWSDMGLARGSAQIQGAFSRFGCQRRSSRHGYSHQDQPSAQRASPTSAHDNVVGTGGKSNVGETREFAKERGRFARAESGDARHATHDVVMV